MSSDLNPSFDLVVIGAGIQGASAAYNLAKRGYGRVLVAERGTPDDLSGSTPRSASMIMQQTGNRKLSEMAKLSYEIMLSLSDELDRKIPFTRTGSILYGAGNLGMSDGSDGSPDAVLRQLLREQNELGIPTEWLNASSLAPISKGLLAGSSASFGIFCERDGYTSGTAVRDAYLQAFGRLGGEVWFGAEVTGIDDAEGHVSSVAFGDGRKVATGAVLNCAGIYAAEVSSWVGVNLPLTVDRRFLAILDRPAELPELFPIIEDHRHEWYFRPDPAGVLMGVGPTETLTSADLDAPDPSLDERSIALAGDYLAGFVPCLKESKILRSWAGRRPMISTQPSSSPLDALPRLGPISETQGVFQSTGWGAFGVTLAFVGGQLAAQYVCGETPSIMLDPEESRGV